MPRRAPALLLELLQEAVTQLRGLRRAADAQRDVLTLAQAARALQVRDATATVWLRERDLVRTVCGNEVVLRSELVAAIGAGEATAKPATSASSAREAKRANARGLAAARARVLRRSA